MGWEVGGGSRRRGYTYTSFDFMLMYGRNQLSLSNYLSIQNKLTLKTEL